MWNLTISSILKTSLWFSGSAMGSFSGHFWRPSSVSKSACCDLFLLEHLISHAFRNCLSRCFSKTCIVYPWIYFVSSNSRRTMQLCLLAILLNISPTPRSCLHKLSVSLWLDVIMVRGGGWRGLWWLRFVGAEVVKEVDSEMCKLCLKIYHSCCFHVSHFFVLITDWLCFRLE